MSKYADRYLLPIAEANVADYKKIATKAGKIFIKNEELRYREYVPSDLKAEVVVRFDKLLKLNPARRSFSRRSNLNWKDIEMRR